MNPHSSYLEPQKRINDPLNELTKKEFYKKQDEALPALISDMQLPENWNDFIHSVTNEQLENDLDLKTDPTKPYMWKKEKNQIKIFVNHNTNYSKESDFEISAKYIHSPIISGDLLYPVLNHTVTQNQDGSFIIVLDLNPEIELLEWPVLISGGENVDAFSSFLLAKVSLDLSQIPSFFYWALKSAKGGYVFAKKTLGSVYLSLKSINESIYWFSQFALETNDEYSQLVVSQFLFESNPPDCDPLLAENILINVAKNGSGDAFYELGYLHLQSIPNWNNDEKLAIRYLHEASDHYQDRYAMDLLSQCYRTGAGCQKDIQKATYYSRLAKGSSTTEANNSEIKNDVAGIVISAAAITGTAFIGYYLFKKLFRK